VTATERAVHRVVQIGNASSGPGGVASVVRVVNGWADAGLEVDEWPTYWHGDRRRSLRVLAATALRVATARRRPDEVWHFHLTQRGSFLREGLLLALAHRRGVCCTVAIHGSSFVAFTRAHRGLVTRVLAAASAVFVLTDAAREELQGLGLPATKVVNPVPLDSVPPTGTRAGFVFAGEVGRRKGVDTLLRAWQSAGLTDSELVVLGPTEPGFQLPEPLPAGVQLVGPVEPAEVLARLRGALALVLPSRAEAMPMSMLEAMSVGAPVIGTDVGQVRELVAAGGVIVPVDDPEALAQQLRRFATSPGLADELGAAARAVIEERHSSDAVKAVFLAEWVRCLDAARTAQATTGRTGTGPAPEG